MNMIDMWKRTGLLKRLDEDRLEVVATALENQRRFNESDASSGVGQQFRRLSIPAVRRIFNDIEFKCSLGPPSKPIHTGISFSPRGRSLDDEAEYTAEMASEVKRYIVNWTREHGPLDFKALSVEDGKIVIYE